MYCYKCGAQNEDIARFCRACGTQLKTDSFVSNPYKKVILVNCGRNIMKVIKEIRRLTGAGLAEARNLAVSTPVVLKEGISESEAQSVKNTFTAIGAVVEIN